MTSFQLVRDRDAWATIRGYVYQVDMTIDRWLDLQPGQVLELERGEDIDSVSEAIQVTDRDRRQRLLEQVKHRTSSLSLRSPEVIAALVNFFEHGIANPGASLHFRFVTNARSGHEQHSPLPNHLSAIEAWGRLQQEQGDQNTRRELLQGIRSLLTSLQKEQKPHDIHEEGWERFHTFVCNADDEALTAFIRSIEWGMQTADANSLRQLLQQRLQALQYARDADHANTIYCQMFFTVFERLTHPGLKRLTVENRTQLLARPSFDARAQALLGIIHDLLNTLDERVGVVEARINAVEAVQVVQAGQLATLQNQRGQMMHTQDSEAAITYEEYVVPSPYIQPLTKKLETEHTMLHPGRRLIEDLFPIRAVSSEAMREKSQRHGHISTLHPWWARRPIVAARALVYGVLVSAPTNDEERKISKDFMKELCRRDFHQDILEQARLDILAANKGRPPRVLDMFTSGGSIPLEALRLGCETYAVDLNPVAYVLELCTLDYPQRYGPSLVGDVKRWGTWVITQAREGLAEWYPPLTRGTSTTNGVQQRNSINEIGAVNVGDPLTPVAYLWTHTVICPNCSATVPLVRQTWLRKKTDNCIALRALPDRTTKSVRFEVAEARKVDELGFDPGANNKRGNVVCLHCGIVIDREYIKTQGQTGKLGQKLMAAVCTQQASPWKIYLADEDIPYSIERDALLARVDALCDEYELSLPGELVPQHLTGGIHYGLTRFKDFFTPRQLLSLLTFTIEVRHAYHAMLDDGMDPERAAAITTYLGVMINHLVNHNSSFCCWDNVREASRQTFTRQALPMVWDFAEINPFEGSGSPTSALNWITLMIQELVHSGQRAYVERASALRLPFSDHTFDAIITDPPYYDRVHYADLSDFFYVWLKRSIGFLYPEDLRASLTPREQEAVMTDNRPDQSEKVTKQNYERMIAQAFGEAHRVLKPGAPLVCIHPYTSTGDLPTLSNALRHAGFVVTETWRLDAEMTNRSAAHGRETLTSDIILVARRGES